MNGSARGGVGRGGGGQVEAPLKQFARWTALDVIVKAGGRAVVDRCPELCVQASGTTKGLVSRSTIVEKYKRREADERGAPRGG